MVLMGTWSEPRAITRADRSDITNRLSVPHNDVLVKWNRCYGFELKIFCPHPACFHKGRRMIAWHSTGTLWGGKITSLNIFYPKILWGSPCPTSLASCKTIDSIVTHSPQTAFSSNSASQTHLRTLFLIGCAQFSVKQKKWLVYFLGCGS